MVLRSLAAVGWLLAISGTALAQTGNVGFGAAPQDSSAPVEATSDELFIDENDGTAVFTGNVVITQAEMILTAPRVEVFYLQDVDQIDRIVATGGVTIVSGPDAAESADAVYDFESETIVMTGDVLVTQGPQVLSGQEFVIFMADGTAKMTGRVRTVLQGGD
ncbi:MAG: LptA/OstA family protein [Pseudomonadota bacterium]